VLGKADGRQLLLLLLLLLLPGPWGPSVRAAPAALWCGECMTGRNPAAQHKPGGMQEIANRRRQVPDGVMKHACP
jgi:hypothetical protein